MMCEINFTPNNPYKLTEQRSGYLQIAVLSDIFFWRIFPFLLWKLVPSKYLELKCFTE